MTDENSVTINEINVIILGGNLDFGRCELSSRLHTALWPVGGKPALEHLLYDLKKQGLRNVTLCANGHSADFRDGISIPEAMDLTFLKETLPMGTAGCIRSAAKENPGRLYLILHANSITAPDIKTLLNIHLKNTAVMTIALPMQVANSNLPHPIPEAYLCNSSVLEYIPRNGYFDIKEGLVPLMVKDHQVIKTVSLKSTAGLFRNRQEYLYTMSAFLEKTLYASDSHISRGSNRRGVKIDPHATVDPDCRIIGPAWIMSGSVISRGAIIAGPAIIGRDVTVGRDTCITNSTLWDRSRVEDHCEICNSIVGYDIVIPHNRIIENDAVAYNRNNKTISMENALSPIRALKSLPLALADNRFLSQLKMFFGELAEPTERKNGIIQKLLLACLLIGIFIWSYWPEVHDLWKIWQRSDEYSGGMIVPFLAVYILWARRHQWHDIPANICLWGLVFFALSQAMRYFGLFFMYASAERLSLVIAFASIVLLLFGWRLFFRVAPILLFLLLMLPFPQSVQTAITLPLQNLATKTAVFFLELLGYNVMREGNIIYINNTYVAVAEACNGLRMVTAFFIIITMVALLIQRTWWEKLILIASGVPIALLCNSIRLTVTAVAFTVPELKNWQTAFHDFGGYAMMPVALVMVIAELWLLKKMLITPQPIKS